MYKYRTYFKLTAPVKDIDSAQSYLSEDDMTKYLLTDSRSPISLTKKVTNIEWILKDEISGYIELESTKTLSEIELEIVSEWVSGQNSDGIGEGFEQQNFAYYPNDDYDEEDLDNDYIMASFDWKTNKYKFEIMTNI